MIGPARVADRDRHADEVGLELLVDDHVAGLARGRRDGRRQLAGRPTVFGLERDQLDVREDGDDLVGVPVEQQRSAGRRAVGGVTQPAQPAVSPATGGLREDGEGLGALEH